jgi:hypothetical protein
MVRAVVAAEMQEEEEEEEEEELYFLIGANEALSCFPLLLLSLLQAMVLESVKLKGQVQIYMEISLVLAIVMGPGQLLAVPLIAAHIPVPAQFSAANVQYASIVHLHTPLATALIATSSQRTHLSYWYHAY